MEPMRLIARIALVLSSSGIVFLAYLFSPWHGEAFPFGGGLSSALLCMAVIGLWAAFRLHRSWEMRTLGRGFLVVVVGGGIGLPGGVVWGIWGSDEDLSMVLGLLVTGPIGFVAGAILGIAVEIFRHFRRPKGSV